MKDGKITLLSAAPVFVCVAINHVLRVVVVCVREGRVRRCCSILNPSTGTENVEDVRIRCSSMRILPAQARPGLWKLAKYKYTPGAGVSVFTNAHTYIYAHTRNLHTNSMCIAAQNASGGWQSAVGMLRAKWIFSTIFICYYGQCAKTAHLMDSQVGERNKPPAKCAPFFLLLL